MIEFHGTGDAEVDELLALIRRGDTGGVQRAADALAMRIRGLVANERHLPSKEFETRFWAKVDKRGDGCWNWLGVPRADGYALIVRDRRKAYAHRVSYEIHKGAIPDGYYIDHLCRNRRCVNPAHLDAVPPGVNSLRGMAPNFVVRRRRLGLTTEHACE